MPTGSFTANANIRIATPLGLRVVHRFQSGVNDGVDTTKVRPSNWNNEHLVVGEWLTYTPTVTASSGGFAIGNGTLTGRYHYLDNKTILWSFYFLRGSTTTNGTGTYSIGLPAGITIGPRTQTGAAFYHDAGTTYFAGSLYVTAGATSLFPAFADGSVNRAWSSTIPATPATGDEVLCSATIEIA